MSLRKTFQEVLRERAAPESPGRLLLYPLGNASIPLEITYAKLFEMANAMSRIVQTLPQFEVGRPVLLHFDDHWDTILWFWSVLLADGLPVLSSLFSNDEDDRYKHIQSLSALLESPLSLTRSKFLHQFGDDHGLYLHTVEHLLQESESDLGSTQGEKENRMALKPKRTTSAQARCFHDDTVGVTQAIPSSCDYNFNRSVQCRTAHLMMLMLTSGSTGSAKAVQFTHEQVLTAVSNKAAVRRLPSDRPFLNWIGLDHVAGLIEIHLQALWLGVDQVHVSAAEVVPSPRVFIDLLSRHRISRTFAPNFFLAKILSVIELQQDDANWDLSSLVCIASGGEANDVKTCLAVSALLQKYGAPPNVITPGFGMTETCAGAIFNTNFPHYDLAQNRTVASIGKCMTGIEMRITAPGNQGARASPEEVGSLEVRGPVVFAGYYRNENATNDAFTGDLWFRTGDQGFVDLNGNLSLVGRAKDVVNINGVKIAMGDIQTSIEQALGDRVTRLIVFPSAALQTEQVTIAYVPKSFPVQDEEMAKISNLGTQSCLMITATCPLIFALRSESLHLLPASTLGKISRLQMARLFERGVFDEDVELHNQAISRGSFATKEICASDRLLTTDSEACMINDVADVLGTKSKALQKHMNSCIFDIGFTSMHVIQLKSRLEKRVGIDIPVIRIMKNPTIRALAADLDSQLQQTRSISCQTSAMVPYDPVVEFRATGSKLPLWLIHPGVGEVLVFVGLAQCLAMDDRPIFALRAAGFEPGQKRFSSIAEAVDIYCAAIQKRQPRGPYALAGYSYGTMLAFETAKRLRSNGDTVSFLGSFNLPPHIKSRMRQLNWNICLLHLAHFLGLVTEEVSDTFEADPDFCVLPRADAVGYALHVADQFRLEELSLTDDALSRWVDVAFGLQRMAADYDPSGEVETIDIFHAIPLTAAARSREEWLQEHLSRWADFVLTPPRYHAVQGAHYTMIGPENVASFADTLMKALKARGI